MTAKFLDFSAASYWLFLLFSLAAVPISFKAEPTTSSYCTSLVFLCTPFSNVYQFWIRVIIDSRHQTLPV
ncbi:hypothetical protein BC943DRAFT_327114 [Umbelopsis sp. AD052]|nr:hypothetical protein BC943DRAFT_327114 [Umbelopsis sp. AD052]